MTLKKIVKVFALMETLAMIAAFAAFAEGWDDSSGSWQWIKDDGTAAVETWKSANGYWFYIDSSGLIARNKLIIEETNKGTNYYYVDSNGMLLRDAWKAVALDVGDRKNYRAQYWWYYFGNDGKAYKSKGGPLTIDQIKTIEGKRYAFDADGRMLYGWINSNNVKIQDYDESAWRNSDYYFGDWDDGHAVQGWKQMRVYVPKEGTYKDYWFYFDAFGKKAKSEKKRIDGVTYVFDSDGHMSTTK
ncbi:MAG: hypothetical protein K6A76_01390 [Oribacterium sp.]|nr:hypothetical protein [Oribacterium sp.]